MFIIIHSLLAVYQQLTTYGFITRLPVTSLRSPYCMPIAILLSLFSIILYLSFLILLPLFIHFPRTVLPANILYIIPGFLLSLDTELHFILITNSVCLQEYL